MIEEIKTYIEKYPEEIIQLFLKIREVIFTVEDISIEEKMWAKLPSYYFEEKFVRIIPFKDHINVEAAGFIKHTDEFSGCKFTPKGMLQIRVNEEISFEALKEVFRDTFL